MRSQLGNNFDQLSHVPIGAWTPAQIPGLVADYNFNVGAYSDAGSTPATDGGGLYRLTPASAPTLYAEQTSAGSRPTYNIGANDKRSGIFDGNDHLSIAYNAALDFGTGDFFIIFLAARTFTSITRYLFSKQKASANYNGIGLGINGSFKPYLEIFDGTPLGGVAGATTLNLGSFYTIAGGRTGSTAKILVNNVEDYSGACATGSVSQSVAATIGCFSGGGNAYVGEVPRALLFNTYPASADLALLQTYLTAQIPT